MGHEDREVEFRHAIGDAAMDAMDKVDADLVEVTSSFYRASRIFTQVLLEKGIEPDKVIGQVANMSVGAAFHAINDA